MLFVFLKSILHVIFKNNAYIHSLPKSALDLVSSLRQKLLSLESKIAGLEAYCVLPDYMMICQSLVFCFQATSVVSILAHCVLNRHSHCLKFHDVFIIINLENDYYDVSVENVSAQTVKLLFLRWVRIGHRINET